MSQWTHVSGCIRIDGMPSLGLTVDLEKLLGRQRTWEDEHDAENIPKGSEGSIRWKEIRAGDGMVFYTVAIWGDLRDFGPAECEKIDAWFTRIVTTPSVMFRDAVLHVSPEYHNSYILVLKSEIIDGKIQNSVEKIPALKEVKNF